MATAVESGQLERCPRCLYSLHGLPIEHRCPECGLAVDRRWRVFGGKLMRRSSMRPMQAILLFPFLVFACAFAAVLILALQKPSSVLGWLLVAAIGSLWLFLAWLLFARPTKFVAVGPEGLAVHWRPTRFEHYTWDRLGGAEYNLLRKTIDIELDRDRIRLSAFAFFRGNVFEAEDCVRGINILAQKDRAG